MNPKYLEILNKVDVKKTAMYVGGALLLIALFLVVRKMIRKAKNDRRDDDYLDLVNKGVDTAALSYTEVEYQTMATSLECHFADTGLSGGWHGVNRQGVYDVMKQMRTNADVQKLIDVYGKRPAKDISMAGPLFSGLVKEKEYMLPEAMAQLLTNGERKKVNAILEENGVTFQFK